jgi:hypothetical protein
MIRVTIENTDTGKTETETIASNDYWIITTGTCYVSNTQVYPKTGTHQLTIKGRQ